VGGRTPAELASLLEDAVVLQDAAAVAELFEAGGALSAGPGTAWGCPEVAQAAPGLWLDGGGYLADARSTIQVHDLTLVVGARSVTVARRGVDAMWRYAIAWFVDEVQGGPDDAHRAGQDVDRRVPGGGGGLPPA
jgi:hypothetical protein